MILEFIALFLYPSPYVTIVIPLLLCTIGPQNIPIPNETDGRIVQLHLFEFGLIFSLSHTAFSILVGSGLTFFPQQLPLGTN